MKFNKYDQNNRKWRVGLNIGKLRKFTAIPKVDKDHVIYIAEFVNIHDVELKLAYGVPFDKKPHQVLRDLCTLAKAAPAPWCKILLMQVAGIQEPVLKALSIIENQEEAKDLEPKVIPAPGPVGGKLVH